MQRIQHSYLMWVGEGHYASVAEYVDEVRKLGVSKRLPGIGMANALSEPGAIVLVAHDDGEAYSCDECLGQVECASCRTWQGKINKWQAEADRVRKVYEDEDETPRGKERIIEIREARIAKARKAMSECELCDGEGSYECGTGGYAVRADGSRIDYRAYNYWMRQPHRFNVESEIRVKSDGRLDLHMCAECGGTGKRPAAVIFGAFVPTIEVVRSGKENELVEEQIARFGQLSVAEAAREPERKGGQREPGFYAMAKAGKPSKAAQAVAKELVARRAVKGEPEVIGDFILFAKPVKAGELKRFRGVKRYDIIPEVERRSA